MSFTSHEKRCKSTFSSSYAPITVREDWSPCGERRPKAGKVDLLTLSRE